MNFTTDNITVTTLRHTFLAFDRTKFFADAFCLNACNERYRRISVSRISFELIQAGYQVQNHCASAMSDAFTFGFSFLAMVSQTFRLLAFSCSMVKCFFLDKGRGISCVNLAKILVAYGRPSAPSSSPLFFFFFTFFSFAARGI